jgi:hypothetical protein
LILFGINSTGIKQLPSFALLCDASLAWFLHIMADRERAKKNFRELLAEERSAAAEVQTQKDGKEFV